MVNFRHTDNVPSAKGRTFSIPPESIGEMRGANFKDTKTQTANRAVGMWLIDRDTIYRERMTKGDQRANALSRISGRKRLVWTNFDPATAAMSCGPNRTAATLAPRPLQDAISGVRTRSRRTHESRPRGSRHHGRPG